MTDQNCSQKNKINIEQVNMNKNYLKKQYIELEISKIRIELISSMKKKEILKRDKQSIQMKQIKGKIITQKMKNCDYIQNLMENHWLMNFQNNFKNLTQNKKIDKNKTNTSSLCNKLEEEINETKSILEGLYLKRCQDKTLIELTNKIKNTKHSIKIWNDKIMKIEKQMQT